jgi:rare lipoprotein A
MRLPVNFTLPLAAFVVLGGALAHAAPNRPEPLATSGPAADYPVVIGAPFVIDGVTYSPSDALNSDAVGYAVAGSEGGEAVSIAHKTLPLPSYAEVTSLDSGKTILVRVERRGPMTNDRLVELSPGAAAQLGISGTEKASIRIRRVNPPEIERAALRSGQRAPSRMDTPASLLTVLKRKLEPAAVPVVVASPVIVASPAIASPAPKPSAQAVLSPAPITAPAPVAVQTSSTPVLQTIPGQAVLDPYSTPVVQPLPIAITPKAVASKATSASSRVIIVQVGAFANRLNAETLAEKLGARTKPSGALFRVVMGPFANRAEAQAALVKVKQAGYSDARIQTDS